MIRHAGRTLSLSILLLGLCIPAFAGGGKAEPFPIQLKNGRANIDGNLKGDLQFESMVSAKRGQWLEIEVVSTPVDSAVFVVREPQGKHTPAQYRWAGTLTQTGDYVIWVTKPADYKTSRFSLKVTLLPAKPAAMQYSATDATGAALYSAMRKFIDAFRKKDGAAFLSAFSRSRPSHHLNPMNIGSRVYRSTVTYR